MTEFLLFTQISSMVGLCILCFLEGLMAATENKEFSQAVDELLKH